MSFLLILRLVDKLEAMRRALRREKRKLKLLRWKCGWLADRMDCTASENWQVCQELKEESRRSR